MSNCIFTEIEEPDANGWRRMQCKICNRIINPTPHQPESIFAKCRSRGLGDTVAKLASAVGIKPCGGCKERQAALNKVLPY